MPAIRCPRCGAALPPGRFSLCPACLLMDNDEPVVIGETLELHEELGRGGMGSVHRARHLRLNRFVAVKFLSEQLATPEFQTRFEREARALALLNHPNIVTIHDYGREGGQSYLVMELVDGGSLAKLIPLPLERAIDVAIQICDALEYAHRQGVVHRDIKPENVLLDESGRVKVSDFGLARMVRPEARGWTVTTPDVTVGTPHFMSPEALAGAPPEPRMDIYSLGVLLYELVTGKLPMGAFAPPPVPLEPIIRKALAPEPQDRYATAAEMRRDLAAVAHSSGLRSAATPLDDLPHDEKLLMRAVALLQAISTAVAIWAALEFLTPKDIPASEFRAHLHIGAWKKDEHTYHSPARFEMWPAVATLATFVVAITAYALLRRHWRLSGLERPQPERRVREAGWVFCIGIVAIVVQNIRILLANPAANTYIPILGAGIEVSMLFFLWISILQCWRSARPLWREPWMWVGFAISLIPPATELLKLSVNPLATLLPALLLVIVFQLTRRRQ